MIKICNFVDPHSDIINKLNIYNFTSTTHFKYLVSDTPHRSADILCISPLYLHQKNKFSEFSYIPFIVYGNEKYLEKSFISGASDFLKDPWSFRELEIRSSRYMAKDKITINNKIIQFTNSNINCDDEIINMTVNEYKIISILANNADKIISKENIYYKLGIENNESRVIDVYINSIRNKINQLLKNELISKKVIKTIRGKGYSINSQYTCG